MSGFSLITQGEPLEVLGWGRYTSKHAFKASP